ncbi:MAG: metallophosphoesterase [Pseudomonadota bacterium]|nr:metallophosphoesterase [Pseudomonadota bacterium]
MWPDGLSLILRFRDLVTSPGDTLRQHTELLGPRKPRVWWGWWNKAGERAPAEVFQHLQSVAQKSGLDLLLFDSGRSRVHRARCTDVHWKATPGPSPKKPSTPSYYREQQYLAWFELESIDLAELHPETLHAWTYHKINAFFEKAPSRFDAFYDKQVASPEELRQQDRSIWFVRPFKVEDRTNVVSLLDARTLRPSNFPKTFEQMEEDTLLWLSDTHFSVDGHHNFPQPPGPQDPPVERPGERPIEHAIQRELGATKVGGLLLTGDISWRADPAEFVQARNMIWRLLGLRSSYRVALVPGNHDLAFSKDPAKKDAPIKFVGAESKRAYEEELYAKLFYLPPPPCLASGRRFLVGNAVPVEVACLNSSNLQQHKKAFQGHGFVGDDQLELVEKEMGWTSVPTRALPFRIVMLHHHVVPVTHRELPQANASYSVVLDAVALLRWCVKHRVGLILHGHMHQPHVTKLSLRNEEGAWHTITIAAMGSSGVVANHLGEVAKNTFGLLRFGDDALDLTFHTLHRTNPTEELKALAVSVPYRQEA